MGIANPSLVRRLRRTSYLGLVGASTVALLLTAFAQGCSSETEPDSEFGNGTTSGSSGASSGSSGESSSGFSSSGTSGASSGSSGEDPTKNSCATASAEAKRLPVYMLFVIDGSGSMDGFDGVNYIAGEREADPASPGRQTGKKWIATRDALGAFFDDLASKNDPSFAVGMYLFSSTALKPATGVDVAINFVNAAQATALKTRLAPPVFPNSGTPLAESITGQLAILKAYTPAAPVQPGGKYVLVAMTDGIPTDSKTTAINALTTARTGTPPVATFAVGVGNEDASPTTVYDEAFMKDLAVAGGTAAAGCNPNWGNADKTGKPCHFQITPGTKTAAVIKTEFLAAINTIRDQVSSCEFPLVKPAGSGDIDPANVNVVKTAGGKDTTIPQDAANGWVYDDPSNPSKVTLKGKACDDLKADPTAKIKIVVGCKTLTTPTK